MLEYNIIIPHKNDPKRLQRCLDSIPLRDDLRIIVVDDNSDPSIVDFDHFPGKERHDIEFIFDKVGGGAGHARNIALSHATAQKIINADCDDFFTYCFNDVLDEYKDDDADVVFLNVCSVIEGTYLHSGRCAYKNKLIDGYLHENPEEYDLLLRYDEGSPCSKIIKKSLLDKHGINFEEVPIHDDVKFSYLIGHYAQKIKVDERAIYCISETKTSISFTLNEEKYLTRMHVIGERDRFVQNLGLNLDCTGKFLVRTLVEIYERGNNELYERCLSILRDYDFDSKKMHAEVVKAIKVHKRNKCRAQIKRYIHKILG